MVRRVALRFFLDNCVPDSVGRVLAAAGHRVIYQREAIAPDAADLGVALASAANNAILLTLNRRDHERLASRFHVCNKRLKKLSRIDLAYKEPDAAARIKAALDFIESEWAVAQKSKDGRMFLTVQGSALKTQR